MSWDIYKKIRKTWEINPKTRVVPNRRRKNRQTLKREVKDESNSTD